MSGPASGPELELVDDAYLAKMAAFESDCNDGKGEPAACHHVGEFYSVVRDEHDRAARVYRDNCSRYSPSCFNLAKLHLAGRGVTQDDGEATKLFQKACKEGNHLAACYHQGVLAFLSADGKNPRNPQQKKDERKQQDALRLLEKNCQGGEADSCYFVGSHLLNPETDPRRRDPVKALELLKRACDANHGPSCFNLARLFLVGDKGVTPDPAQHALYKDKTEVLVSRFGALQGRKTG